MGRKALNTKVTEDTEAAKLRTRFSRQRGPRAHRDVRWLRRGFTRITNHESQISRAQLGPPLEFWDCPTMAAYETRL